MSENVNFYQGSKKNYNPSEMQGGLYFSKDSKEILLNGESYGNAMEVKDWVNEQGFARTSDLPEGLEIGETTGTAFDGGRGKAAEDIINNIKNVQIPTRIVRNDIYGRDVNNLRVEYVVPSTGAKSSYDVQFKTATTELAGLMSIADKKKLDSLSNSSDVYVIDYITDDSGTITQEQYNEIKAAIEENKVIIFTVDTLQYVVTCSFLEDSSLKLYFSLNDITQGSGALQVNALILRINSNGEYYTESPHINLYSNGDGTRFLSDNGTYKTIEIPDLSNYLTEDDKTELETEIGDLTETVSTINDTVSGLDNKYLPLSGGTLDGSIYFDSARSTEENPIHELIINRSGGSQYITVGSRGRIQIRNGDIGTNCNFVTCTDTGDFLKKDPENPGIQYKAVMTTTNPYAGNQMNVNYISQVTQSIYDGLSTKDANTLYIITE